MVSQPYQLKVVINVGMESKYSFGTFEEFSKSLKFFESASEEMEIPLATVRRLIAEGRTI